MRRSSTSARRAERHLAAVQAQNAVEAAGALDVVARHEQRPALGAQLLEHAGDQRGARRVDPRQRLVEQQQARVLHERACQQGALALATGELAEARAGAVGEADALERGRSRRPVGPARRQPPASARERPHQRDVERGDREVEPGALGLGDVGGAAGAVDAPGLRSQLAEQYAEERGLAAAVGAEHADGLARLGLEAHVAEHGWAAVARAEPRDAQRAHRGRTSAITR